LFCLVLFCFRFYIFTLDIITKENLVLPEKWETKRPEELSPVEFIHLTIDLYGEKKKNETSEPSTSDGTTRNDDHVWRKVKIPM
jgi:hypothetical protein